MDAATGIRWALAMFGLDLIECLALIHVLTFDMGRMGLPRGGLEFLEVYFLFVFVSMVAQFAGILMVRWGWYRTGGIVQILSSLLHVPKGEGLIGVIGGLKAYRFGKSDAGAGSLQPA